MSAVLLVPPHPPRPARRRRAPVLAVIGLATALVTALVAGCGTASNSGIVVSSPSSELRGDQLVTPVSLTGAANVPFTSTDGQQTTLGALQTGQLMLVFFGYTHCPDVCPTTMADIGQALRSSPAAVQRATKVVFVTSDPQRDTAPVLRTWLGNFDAGLPTPFVGLTGPVAAIDAAAKAVGVPLEPPTTNSDGTISVTHGAQVLAFRDGKASVVWLSDATPSDYTHDLRILSTGLA